MFELSCCVELANGVDHALRLLRRGGVVEPDQRLAVNLLTQDGKIAANRRNIEWPGRAPAHRSRAAANAMRGRHRTRGRAAPKAWRCLSDNARRGVATASARFARRPGCRAAARGWLPWAWTLSAGAVDGGRKPPTRATAGGGVIGPEAGPRHSVATTASTASGISEAECRCTNGRRQHVRPASEGMQSIGAGRLVVELGRDPGNQFRSDLIHGSLRFRPRPLLELLLSRWS